MFGFHKCNKEGLSRNDDCDEKHTERCARRTEKYQGADVFSECAPLNGAISEQKWGQPLAKSAESIEELFPSERFIFFAGCDTVMPLVYIVNVGNVLCSFMTAL